MISIQNQNGQVFGPFTTVGVTGQNNVQNAAWVATPNIIVPAGVYTVIDSSSATWSYDNTFSTTAAGQVACNCGFTRVWGFSVNISFLVQPTNTTVGSHINPGVGVQVQVLDNQGGAIAAVNVTIALGAGSGTLSGTRTQATSAGIATFSNLSIDTAGIGDTLVASVGSATVTSNAFNVAPLYEIVSRKVSVPASSSANVNVTCSTGNKVLGGGFDIETPVFVQVFSSEPSDGIGNFSDHQWNVFAQNTDPNNARQVTVSAACASATQLVGYEIVSNKVSVSASSSANVNVTCSTGNKVLGGGFDIETPVFVQVFSSEPSDGIGNFSDHQWNVFAQNTDPTNARQTTVSAVCAQF
jgi:hypothetical protein